MNPSMLERRARGSGVMWRRLLLAACSLAALPAAAVTVTPYDTGAVTRSVINAGSPFYYHRPDVEDAYLGNSFGSSTPGELRNDTFRAYALFDVPVGLQNLTGAALQFDFHCLVASCGGADISLSDITSQASAFNVAYSASTSGPAQALYSDLGDGTSYGVQVLLGTDIVGVSIALAPQALAALSSGGFFGIGFVSGSGVFASRAGMLTIPGLDVGSVSGLSNFRLQITAVPEPASSALLALGMLVIGLCRRATGGNPQGT